MNRDIDFSNIKIIAYDFDGVMTDNRVLVDINGNEQVFVNRGDGYAVSKIGEMGYKQVIISTEKNKIVEARAGKLRIDVIYGVEDKGRALEEYCKEKRISLSEVLFIGNDLNDLPAINIVGYVGTPNDAEEKIRLLSDWKSEKNGGQGVIRDLYDTIVDFFENTDSHD